MAFIRLRSSASSARTKVYLIVIRQHPKSWHARRSLISCSSLRWATASRLAAGVTIFSKKVFQRNIVQHGISKQPLQFGVLFFKPPQLPGLRNGHAAQLGLPLVDTGITDTVLTAQIQDRNPSFVLFQYPNNLLFAKSVPLHLSGPRCRAKANCNMDQVTGARSQDAGQFERSLHMTPRVTPRLRLRDIPFVNTAKHYPSTQKLA